MGIFCPKRLWPHKKRVMKDNTLRFWDFAEDPTKILHSCLGSSSTYCTNRSTSWQLDSAPSRQQRQQKIAGIYMQHSVSVSCWYNQEVWCYIHVSTSCYDTQRHLSFYVLKKGFVLFFHCIFALFCSLEVLQEMLWQLKGHDLARRWEVLHKSASDDLNCRNEDGTRTCWVCNSGWHAWLYSLGFGHSGSICCGMGYPAIRV